MYSDSSSAQRSAVQRHRQSQRTANSEGVMVFHSGLVFHRVSRSALPGLWFVPPILVTGRSVALSQSLCIVVGGAFFGGVRALGLGIVGGVVWSWNSCSACGLLGDLCVLPVDLLAGVSILHALSGGLLGGLLLLRTS